MCFDLRFYTVLICVEALFSPIRRSLGNGIDDDR